jgi:tetratricopeptide (TPR) repeat protein
MLIQKALQSAKPVEVNRSLSYQYFLQEGDKAYRQHLEPAEEGNLLEEALNAYSRAQEQAPDEPEVLARFAKVYYLQGNYEKAERYAQRTLNLSKQPAIQGQAYTILGAIAHHKGFYPEAIRTLVKAIRTNRLLQGGTARWELYSTCCDAIRDQFHPYYALIGLYAFVTAALLLPFQKEGPSLAAYLLMLPTLLLAWFHEETGSYNRALRQCLDLHLHLPGSALLGNIIGSIYQKKGKIDEARHWFESVIQRHPGNLTAYCHLAQLYESQEAYLEVAEIYKKLVRLQPGNPHIWCSRANAAYYAQSYREALQCYETALRLGVNRRWKAMIAQSIANIYADTFQNNEAALAYYRMAQELDPTDIENYIQQGLLYFQKEDYDNAERTYQMACRVSADNARLYSNLGYLRWTAGDIETAIQLYEKAMALDSNYEIPLNNLGVIYLDSLGDVQKAIELFQAAIAINDHYALAHYNLGRAYSFLGQRLEAAQCFRVAQDINQFSRELDNEELTARINHLFDSMP